MLDTRTGANNNETKGRDGEMGRGKGPSLGGGNEAVDLGGSDGGAEQQGTHHEAGDLAGRQPLHLSSLSAHELAQSALHRPKQFPSLDWI